jgi:hypothetical protein
MKERRRPKRILAYFAIIVILVSGTLSSLNPAFVFAQEFSTKITDVKFPIMALPGQNLTVTLSVEWSGLDKNPFVKSPAKPPYRFTIGVSDVTHGGVVAEDLALVLGEKDEETNSTSGSKAYDIGLTAPEEEVLLRLVAYLTIVEFGRRPVYDSRDFRVAVVAPGGGARSYERVLDLLITTGEFSPFNPLAQLMKAEFQVKISYSGPSVAAQGDLITVNVKIRYLADYVNRGPLGLTSVSVALRADTGACPSCLVDLVSSTDLSPPTLKVGSEYSRDFKLDLSQRPEDPGLYFLNMVWAIGNAAYDTGRKDGAGVEREMFFVLLKGQASTSTTATTPPIETIHTTTPTPTQVPAASGLPSYQLILASLATIVIIVTLTAYYRRRGRTAPS